VRVSTRAKDLHLRSQRGVLALGAVLVALSGSPAAYAHDPPRPRSREIIRAQGYFGTPPAGAEAARTVELAVLGETRPLNATEWRRFAVEEKQTPADTEEPARIIVQGARADLQRLKKARPEQRVTLLAERRTGSTDLFVLAVDLCPSD
jgi:hypothetical protein